MTFILLLLNFINNKHQINKMKPKQQIGLKIKTFTITKKLGSGSFGSVFEATDQSQELRTVAVKRMEQKLQSPKFIQFIKTQKDVLKSCKNDNVIYYVDSFRISPYIYIITEYCNGGDLQKYLQKKQKLSEDEATQFLVQILNGFKGLHEVGAMHRDFKLSNVLLHNGVCKIADLGFAKQMGQYALSNTFVGTSAIKAPEVLQCKPYGFKADIWSIGVVYYQMLYGELPFTGYHDSQLLYNIKNNCVNFNMVNISNEAKDFIERCLTIDPKKRIGWDQIYFHKLITEKSKSNILLSLESLPKENIKLNEIFYSKVKLPEVKNLQNMAMERETSEFECVKEITKEKKNLNELLRLVNEKKQKQQIMQKTGELYLKKRNNIRFAIIFILPYIHNYHYIKANHYIVTFLLLKKTLIQMKQFSKNITNKKNIFTIQKYFQQFTQCKGYQTLTNRINQDLQQIQSQCIGYSQDISTQTCTKQIINQLDSTRIINFQILIESTLKKYWDEIFIAYFNNKKNNKQSGKIVKILKALHYYITKKQNIDSEQFNIMMDSLKLEQAEKQIMGIFDQKLRQLQ